MKNLWLDLTDLFEWKGHFTGIQRVTYNYASRFNEKGTARFFVYSDLYDRFIEIPFAVVAEFGEENKGKLAKRQRVKRKLKRYYQQLPGFIRRISRPILYGANRAFRKFAAIVLDRVGRDHSIRKLPEAIFSEEDTVLLLGACWNSGKLIDRLTVKKEALNLNVIVHLNDILPIYQPHLFAKGLPKLFSKYVHKALRISGLVTVISQATKEDVMRYCKEHDVDLPKVEVIRLGEDIATKATKKPDIRLADKFILGIGTFEIRKNYILLYQAVKLAQSEGRDLPQIIIAGRKGWLTEDLQYVIEHDPAVTDKIVLLEKMSDENLSWLYDNCMFTVFCSLAEGWGLPIAESLQHGKICLSSDTSSMPEIAGDMIDYFSPFDPRACLNKLIQYVEHDEYVDKNKQITKSYKIFTWDDSFVRFRFVVEGISSDQTA